MKKKQVTLRIDESLWNRLRQEAESTATPVIHLVESFCTYGLEHNLPYGVVTADNTTGNTIAVTPTVQEMQHLQERLERLEQRSVTLQLPDEVWNWWSSNRGADYMIKIYQKHSSQNGQEGASTIEDDQSYLNSSITSQRANIKEQPKEVATENTAEPYEVLLPKGFQSDRVFIYDEGMNQSELCKKYGINQSNLSRDARGLKPYEYLHQQTKCVAVRFPSRGMNRDIRYYF